MMNPEIITLAKQFHLSVLYRGRFTPEQEGLSGEEYLLSVLRAEPKPVTSVRRQSGQNKPAFPHTKALKSLTPASKKGSPVNSWKL